MRLPDYVIVVATSFLVAGCALSQRAVNWNPASDFPPDDRRHILELAEAVGFPSVESVSSLETLPSGNPYVLAVSHSRSSGRKRTWSTLQLCDSRNSLACKIPEG